MHCPIRIILLCTHIKLLGKPPSQAVLWTLASRCQDTITTAITPCEERVIPEANHAVSQQNDFVYFFWVLSCYYNCFLSQGALMTKFDTEVQAYQNRPVQLVIILCRHKVQGLARYRHSTVGMAVVPLICSSLVNYCCY